MPIKKRNQQDSTKNEAINTKDTLVTFDDAEMVANELADKVYGQQHNARENDEERLTISMKGTLYDQIEELARKRKKNKDKNKSMSAIAREAIQKYIKIHNS
jgi:hypothetical protein